MLELYTEGAHVGFTREGAFEDATMEEFFGRLNKYNQNIVEEIYEAIGILSRHYAAEDRVAKLTIDNHLFGGDTKAVSRFLQKKRTPRRSYTRRRKRTKR